MIRRWRQGVLLAAVAAAVVAGVLLATQPWGGETLVQEAAGQPSEYTLCNVSVSDIPADVAVGPYLLGEKFHVLIYVPVPEGEEKIAIDPDTGKGVPVESRIAIDAETGQVVFEHYKTPAEEAKLMGVLATLRVAEPDPSVPAWPRTDTPPQADKKDLRGLDWLPGMRYRPPDPGSGLVVSVITGTSLSSDSQTLVARTCDSEVRVDRETGQTIKMEVTPGEKAMFRRFLDEVLTP